MTDYAKLRVVDLKAELKRRDLPQHGLKAELVARLESAGTEESKENVVVTEVAASDGAEGEAGAQDQHHAVDLKSESEQKQEAEPEPAPEPEPVSVSEPQPEPVPQTEPTQEPQASDTQTPDTAIEKEPLVEFNAAQEPSASLPIADAPVDDLSEISQKRKRRSVSPPPEAEAVAKRARLEGDASDGDNAPPSIQPSEDVVMANTVEPSEMMEQGYGHQSSPRFRSRSRTRSPAPTKIMRDAPRNVEDNSPRREVVPSTHPATTALYISNLMRPLRPGDVRSHLAGLASPRDAPINHNIITNFYLDHVRTHAFAVFTTISAASRARSLLHGSVWPNERNRKALFVDFVPEELVEDWIKQESKGGRSGTRWEVTYSVDADGAVTTSLQPATASLSKPPPTGPSNSRSHSQLPPTESPTDSPAGSWNPPTGPRAKRSGPGPRPPTAPFAAGSAQTMRTNASPRISYTPVPEDLARRRLANLRTYYQSGCDRREFGREYNRYSFEEGDRFVDRGKEVFEGIRPPHRERGGGGGGGGGGGFSGGGGGGRRRRDRRNRARGPRGPPPMRGGDRYIPSGDGGRHNGRRW